MRAMSILSFFRRTKSRYADNKAVDGFGQVVEHHRIMSAGQRTKELAGLMAKDNPTPAEVDRIAKLLSEP